MCIVIPVLTIGLYGVTIESVTILSVYLISTYLLETIEVTLTTVTIATAIFEGISASYCSVLLVSTRRLNRWHHPATSRQIITWSCLLIVDIDMAAERKRHRAQHVRSSRKVTVDDKLLCPVRYDKVGTSVTINISQGCTCETNATWPRFSSLSCKSQF